MRGRVPLAIAAKIREQRQPLAAIETAETGKPVWQSLADIEVAAQYFEFYGGMVNAIHGDTIDLGAVVSEYVSVLFSGSVAVT